jgi:ACS family pantothenate transporter-like MFS transporter
MKEELGFKGNQFNQINTCFTVGYIIGQIPSNLSLQYVKVRCALMIRRAMALRAD